jgi:hypothetical protein
MKPNCLRVISLLVLASAALTAQVARQIDAVPLRNWATPFYWQPNQAERGASGKPLPQLQFSGNAVSTNALTFVAITPCRLVDTRGATANFNGIAPFSGPSLAGGGTLTIPVQSATEASTNTEPAPCGTIPSIAQAYSFNLTVVPHAGGAVDYVSLWPSGYAQPFVATLNDPQGVIAGNAAIVPAGAPTGGISVFNDGPTTADIVIDMNGYFASPTDLNGNTAIGFGTLASNTGGVNNTATGYQTLQSNTSGQVNTASGAYALQSNTSGDSNTASGGYALQANTTGSDNTASGVNALHNNTTGGQNTAIGAQAMDTNTTGTDNTATGYNAMGSNTTGNSNSATGYLAMQNNTIGNNNTASGSSALGNNTSGNNNTASGYNALLDNSTGGNNTASGYEALSHNTTGADNTASGVSALQNNTTGATNTASGYQALQNNTTGNSNMADGGNALESNTTGGFNTASGFGTLQANTIGSGNTALGQGALPNNTSGGSNIAIGQGAASNVGNGNSNNIHIGTPGASGDSAAIRIGMQGTQTSTSIAGIYGGSPGTPNLQVCVDATGLLGTTGCSGTASSRRFKEQIDDMGDRSAKLLELRPVTFFYKPQYDDGSHTLQYGLIAEEVAKIYPDMVGYDKDGQPSSVKYQSLAPMLLNEVQKQNAQFLNQQEVNRKLEEQLAELQAQLSSLAATIARPASSQ